MTHVAPVPHEFKANLNFVENGLSPYWALSSLLINQYDGYADELEFDINGETWGVRFSYQSGGIAPRPTDPIDSETLLEPKIHLAGDGERKADFHVRPRYAKMQTPDGNRINTPFDRDSMPDEGVNPRQ